MDELEFVGIGLEFVNKQKTIQAFRTFGVV